MWQAASTARINNVEADAVHRSNIFSAAARVAIALLVSDFN